MRTHVRAVVVGGGAVGTGIAYALAKAGWTDTLLLERDELTSGSTWHAAGLLPLFNMGYATSHIHDHSVKLYKTLEAETGLNAGFSVVGNLRMAQTDARMDEYQLYASTAETVGIPLRVADPGRDPRRAGRWSAPTISGARSSIRPTATSTPPTSPRRMAKGARQRGVEIVRKAQVDGYAWTGSEWIVTGRIMADRGGNLVPGEESFEIRAEHVVTATGNHAQRTARLLGIRIPAIPVEHQYIVTEPDPALVEFRKSQPRASGAARRRREVVRPRGARRLDPRPLRAGRPGAVRARGAGELPRRPLPARPGADRGGVPLDDPPPPLVGERRPQGRLQRPDLLHARRQPAGRPGAGPAQPLAGRGLLLRHHRRRRHRALPGADDGGGRGRDRHGLPRPQALRRRG